MSLDDESRMLHFDLFLCHLFVRPIPGPRFACTHGSMLARSTTFPLGSWNDGPFHCQRASSQGLGTVLFFRSEGASDDKI